VSGLALYIDPPSHHFLGDRLFDPSMIPYVGDDLNAPHRAVRDHFESRGVTVHTADRLLHEPVGGARKLYVSLGQIDLYRRLSQRSDTVASAFVAFECPIVEPSIYREFPSLARHFRRVVSWAPPEALERFTGGPVTTERFFWPQAYEAVHEALWARSDRCFLVMINSNKLPRLWWRELYTERLRAIEFFHRFGEIDLYGPNWDRTPVRVGRGWIPRPVRRTQRWLLGRWRRLRPHPLYAAAAAASKGRAPSKSETLSRYTFALCFENMAMEGWITEKIFDCFFAGTVPIYLGAPDVLRWIPRETFVDMRDFDGYEALRDHLHGLGEADVQGYREAARRFVASPAFERFHVRAWVDRFRGFFRDDLGVDP
jgi:hypothetical protein